MSLNRRARLICYLCDRYAINVWAQSTSLLAGISAAFDVCQRIYKLRMAVKYFHCSDE